ncbi:DivIVA domain-containing protein [Motilibacter peucedani]|uniref:DivIVA domain-containing protein n=1 Tax=Motilibacter peucedani TaxID=598650 RepID=A0A420XR36_9ACTN|nr:hypothetical protein [Motilibacter peucedani]RKS77366.1 DivIVA domain-containing protein [Motilibacter peucedani]
MPRLHRVSVLRKGYRRREVDEAVARLERAFAEHSPPAAAEVRRIGFELVRRGYEPSAVDRMLDRYEQRCIDAAVAGAPPWQVGDELAHDVGELHHQLDGPPGARFRRVSRLRKGYSVAEVDALVERCLAGLTGPLEGPQDPSADDVRLSSFRRARHGYAEAEVDEVFDRVIDLLLRQAGLRSALSAPFVPQVEQTGYWTGFEPPVAPVDEPEPVSSPDQEQQGHPQHPEERQEQAEQR